MALKTLVKAGNITNLSDARYFAGMGVEIIGFPVGKTSATVLEPHKIKEMAGWLSGVQIALEWQDPMLDENFLKSLLEVIPPDFIQVPENLVESIKKISSLPLLIVTNRLPKTIETTDRIVYTGTILANQELQHYSAQHPVILSGETINSTSVLDIINTVKPMGIELKGGTEISPGLKDFEALSEILELLELDE